nr:hypothetical protein [Treponema sp.]
KIIKEQIFDISRNNLELLLESEKVKINRNCLFSEIMNSQSLKYLLNSEDVEQVVEAIIDVNSDHLLEENEEAMLTIINDRNIKLDKRKQFIRKNKTILSSLSDVDEKECLINLLDQNKVKPCWYNIESCLSKIGPVSALKEFINNNLYILKNDNSISIYDIQKIIHDINDSEIEHNFKDLK